MTSSKPRKQKPIHYAQEFGLDVLSGDDDMFRWFLLSYLFGNQFNLVLLRVRGNYLSIENLILRGQFLRCLIVNWYSYLMKEDILATTRQPPGGFVSAWSN